MLLSVLLQSIADATIHDVEWYPLIVFIVVGCMVISFVILEPKVPVPFTSPRKYIVLDQAYPPVFGILLLWASTATGWTVIWEGIVGTNGVKPYTILILFNALAYLCISVDQTGLFAWLAILISKRAGTNGYRLFFYFFLFEMAMTIVTSNDTVILTLTPIIYYTCVCTNQPPLEFLLKMYYIANIYSMTIFVGSPTNIIIVQAKGLTFFGYLKWMLLPSMVTGFTAYGCSYFLFYDKIRPVFKPMPIEASDALVHKEGAIFGAINLTLVLVFLAIYDQLPGIELWYVGLFFAGIQLAGNIYFYVYHTHVPPTGLDHVMDKLSPVNSPTHGGEQSSNALQPAFSTPAGSAVELDVMEQPTSGNAIVEGDQSDAETAAAVSKLRKALYRKLTIWSAFQAMPWNVVPFAGGMFILVNILRHGRWIDLLSQMMRAGDNLPRSVWLWMGVSSGLCNFINDQPTSIVMTYVLVDEKYYLHIPGEKDGDVFSGAIWALSVGTNLGVCFTLIGALAGIMFQKILAEKGLRITYIQYLKVSFWVILPSVIMGAFAVWVELL